MTRTDHILIAEVLRVAYKNARGDEYSDAWAMSLVHSVAKELADALHRDNPSFNREHFMAVVRGEKELQSHPPRN